MTLVSQLIQVSLLFTYAAGQVHDTPPLAVGRFGKIPVAKPKRRGASSSTQSAKKNKPSPAAPAASAAASLGETHQAAGRRVTR